MIQARDFMHQEADSPGTRERKEKSLFSLPKPVPLGFKLSKILKFPIKIFKNITDMKM